MKRTIWSVRAVALLATAISTPTLAQEEPEDDDRISEIIVTARKQAENLQTVPLAITALTGEALEARSISSSFEIQQTVPSLQIGQIPNGALSALPSLRGQVQEESLISVDPSVGTYVNGVYVGRTDGAVFNMIDIERIEVVKGPQGTLFGRNTTGGAISLFTKKPTLDAISGWVRAGYGEWNRTEVAGVVNLPLSDTFGLRAVGQYVYSDGHAKDVITGGDRFGKDDYQGRLSALWRPSDRAELFVTYDYYRPNVRGGPAARLRAVDPTNLATFSGLAAFEGFLQGTVGPVPLPIGGSGVRTNPDITTYLTLPRDRTASGEPGFVKAKVQSVSANFDYELSDNLDAKVIYGWRKFDDRRSYDLDGTPALIVNATAQFGGEQHSVEGQLLGSNGPLDWVAGAYYFTETGFNNTQNYFLPLLSQGRLPPGISFTQAVNEASGKNRSFAAFAQGNLKLGEKVRLTGGLRWTKDKKRTTIANRTLNATNPAAPTLLACDVPIGIDADGAGPLCRGTQQRSFDYVSWLGSIDFRPDDNTMVWAKISEATRSGGFNVRAGRQGVDAAPFQPETVREYEVGLKTEFWDNRARLNLAAFLSKGSDLQRTQLIAQGGGISTLVQNAAKATFKGIEVEGTFLLSQRLTLNASLSTLDAEYDRYLDGDGVTDLSNTLFRFTSDFQGNVGLAYKVPMADGDLTLSSSYYYVVNYRPAREPVGARGGRELNYGLLDARIQYDTERFMLALFGKNLTDKYYSIADFNFLGQALGYSAENVNQGRSWGIEGTFRF